MLTAGIDIGSITTKVAVVKDGEILGTVIVFTGYNAEKAGRSAMDNLLLKLNIKIDEIDKIIATGYGRANISFAHKAITEISCHAAGAHFTDPRIRSIIDVGGQDSKAILVDEDGRVKDFAMNDKCAAGTGRFLEVMAHALEVELDNFGPLSLQSKKPSQISSICTVFAESEVVSLISRGESRENIIAGIHDSVASRVSALAKRVGVAAPLMMTGGVAKNIGVVTALQRKLAIEVEVSENAQINGALGAAVLAAKL